MVDIYSAVNLHVSPSFQESFGQVGIEALACGTPVLGSRVGGIPEYVIEGETGLLAEPGNASDLADKLDWIVEHPDAAQQFGEKGRTLVCQKFSIKSIGQAYLTLYRSLIAIRREAIGQRSSRAAHLLD
jgi:glycosyltransferase involved in cell wall biosynthesis